MCLSLCNLIFVIVRKRELCIVRLLVLSIERRVVDTKCKPRQADTTLLTYLDMRPLVSGVMLADNSFFLVTCFQRNCGVYCIYCMSYL
jgi:hypothetical protein